MSVPRACLVTTFYPPFNFGGDGIGVQRLARGLARIGYDVTVVHDADAYTAKTRGQDPPAPVEADPHGVRVVTLRSRAPLLSTLLTHQFGRPVVNRRRLRRLLDDGGFDVVVFNNVSLVGGPGLLAYGGRAIKLYVAHEHWLVCPTHVLWRHNRERCDGRECLRCQIRYRRPPQLWRHTGLLDRHLSHIDAFIAMSEFSRAQHRKFGFPRDMEVLPYFLPDPDPAGPAGDATPPHPRPYFLFVGRLEPIKGLDEVIDAFVRQNDADLLIIGDGSHREALHLRAGNHPCVRFLGHVPYEQLATFYRHAVALIVPSLCFETFGIILIEAFSHGTPVIARRLGPFPEIVEPSAGGLLFDTTAELHAAIQTLLGSPDLRTAMGQRGYAAYVRQWSESAVLPRYVDVIDRARARRRAEPT